MPFNEDPKACEVHACILTGEHGMVHRDSFGMLFFRCQLRLGPYTDDPRCVLPNDHLGDCMAAPGAVAYVPPKPTLTNDAGAKPLLKHIKSRRK